MQRPDRRPLDRARSDLQTVDLRRELLDELVRDRLVEVEALDREAGLPAVEEAADARCTDRGVDVGVVEDDHGVGAAELERHALHASRRELGDVLSDRSRPGERHLRDSPFGDEGLTEHRPLAGDHLEDVRPADLLAHDLGDPEGRQRRRLRRLRDHHVAADERRPELVAEQRRREVPGDDRDDDPERPLEDEPVGADVEVRHVSAAKVLRETGVVLERVHEAGDLDPGLAQRLSLLERQLQRELVPRGEDRRCRLVQDLPAPRGRSLPPCRERTCRPLDRGGRVLGAMARDAPDLLARRGVVDDGDVERR